MNKKLVQLLSKDVAFGAYILQFVFFCEKKNILIVNSKNKFLQKKRSEKPPT